MKTIFYVIFLFIFFCTPSFADQASWKRAPNIELFAIQYVLKLNGYYRDKVDGLYGPKMGQAIAEFAKSEEIPSDFDSVSMHMMGQFAMTRRLESNDSDAYVFEKVRQSALDKLEEELFDFESARIKVESIYRGYTDSADGANGTRKTFLVCGEVNAKNRYGAYVGYKK